MSTTPPPSSPNTIGNVSLGLGIASVSLVFGIGFCALVGRQQQWIALLATPLFICGTTSAFLGFLGLVLGIVGLFPQHQARTNAAVGVVLGMMGVCLFLLFLRAINP